MHITPAMIALKLRGSSLSNDDTQENAYSYILSLFNLLTPEKVFEFSYHWTELVLKLVLLMGPLDIETYPLKL